MNTVAVSVRTRLTSVLKNMRITNVLDFEYLRRIPNYE